MTSEVFVDTNVLVYAYDRSEPDKQDRAIQVLDRLARRGTGVVSTQVLGEFFVTVTGKLAAPLTLAQATRSLENHLLSWRVVEVTTMIVREAARGVAAHRFHFWDAQLWATARLNQIEVLLSEDLSDGSMVGGVRFLNPFGTAFQIEDWI